MAKRDYPEDFRLFWAAYPARRQNPMAPAEAVFRRKIKSGEASTEELTACAAAFARECRSLKIEPLWLPHARTWLSQDRWCDYLPEEPGQAGTAPIGASAAADHPIGGLLPSLGEATWRAWIAPLKVERRDGRTVVWAPTRFHASWVRERYQDAIGRALMIPDVEVMP